ncbi:hypothetical protein [Chitinophaga sp.]|uniref:hypothetical protein n=1 Tax=Chitinophaga sp. TaxID=1869181 RepID=UPI002F950494
MTKTAIGLLLLLLPAGAGAQQKKTVITAPMQAANWNFKPGTVEFLTYKSVPAMKILNSPDTVVLKNLDFKDGTIEYDMEPLDPYFASFYFRRSNAAENECFYFRTAAAGKEDAVQYAPFIGGVNLWDMLYHYQNAAWFEKGKWNHVKLVVSGKQLRVYVNDSLHPVLEVPQLEGNSWHGALAFQGQMIIANLVVKPDQTGGLSPQEGVDITNNDARYLRKWQVSPAITMPAKIDYSETYFPGKETPWDTIHAERRGLINLTRKFGGAERGVRRLVWLKTTIQSAVAQQRKLNLGFSDEVWVFVNGKYVYIDKNIYGSPLMKQPDGRCTVDNSSFNLPFMQGNNELLIAVANDFYGWGIIAQLDKLTEVVTEK